MNKITKLGITTALTGALMLSSIGSFAGTQGFGNNIGKDGILDLMIKDGLITQSQIDKYQDQMHDAMVKSQTDAINKLVADGKLTQAKATAVIAALNAQHDKMQALKDKLDSMTSDEAQAYIKANPIQRSDELIKLVENKTITATDYQNIVSVIGGKGHMGGPGMKGKGMHGGPGMMKMQF